MARIFTEIQDDAERILEDSSNVLWTTTVLTAQIKDCLKEISLLSPLRVVEVVQARDNSFEVDISGITDVLEIRHAQYPIPEAGQVYKTVTTTDYRNVKDVRLGQSATLVMENIPQAAIRSNKDGDEYQLTGTVTFADGSTAVSGSGTAFTTELHVGDYIQKSTGTEGNWYRVVTITDTTNIVITPSCDTDDDGADTVDLTYIWHKDVYLHCDKVHRLNEMTDLVGAVDNASGYAASIRNIDVNGVQAAGTVKKNTTFTIAKIAGVYTVTADADIGTGSVALYFYPGLSAAISNADRVTFETSTLTPQLERLLAELVAARATLYWVGKGRTELTDAVNAADAAAGSIFGMTDKIEKAHADVVLARAEAAKCLAPILLANAEFDKETAILAQVLNNIYAGTVEVSKMSEVLADANTALDAMAAQFTLGIADIANGRTAMGLTAALITSAATAIGKMDAEIDRGINSLTAAALFINQTTVGADPDSKHLMLADRLVNMARGYQAHAQALLQQMQANIQASGAESNNAAAEFQAMNAKLNEARGRIAEMGANQSIAGSYAQMALGLVRTAQEHRQQGMAYLQEVQADALSARTAEGVSEAELSTARAEMNQGIAYIRELMGHLSVSRNIMAYKRDAEGNLQRVRSELTALARPKQSLVYGV